jgi:hypothetical protein
MNVETLIFFGACKTPESGVKIIVIFITQVVKSGHT